jgi:hypothetical protein
VYKGLESKSKPNIQNWKFSNYSSLDTENTMIASLRDYCTVGVETLGCALKHMNLNCIAKGFLPDRMFLLNFLHISSDPTCHHPSLP